MEYEPLPEINYQHRTGRRYYINRLVDIICKFGLVLGIISFILGIGPFATALIIVVWVMIALVITLFLLVFTLGLIFFAKSEFMSKLWDFSDVNLIFDSLVKIVSITGPVTASISLLFSIVGLVLTANNFGSRRKGEALSLCITGIVFAVLGLIFGVIWIITLNK